jgi:hypothetical protein
MMHVREAVFALAFGVVLTQSSETRQLNQSPVMRPVSIRLDGLGLHYVTAEPFQYRGRSAVRIVDAAPGHGDDVSRIAVVKSTSMQDGTIEVSLKGDTVPDAPQDSRGFVGIAFRVAGDPAHYECFYLRPKNGRSEDQLRRNHSAQYISVPGFPWHKLREESPGKYESYVDLVPGAWTKVKIQIERRSALLYVNGSDQPTLIVDDLKQPIEKGSVALWVGSGTVAYFTGLSLGR